MKRSRRSRSSSCFSLFLLLLFSFLCTLTFAQTQQTFNHDLPSNSISSSTNDNQDESHSNQTWLSWKDQEALQRLMLTPPTTLPISNPIVIPLKSTFSPERVCLSFLVSFIGSITCLELLLKMSPRLSRKDRQERQDPTQSQASEISSSSNSSNTVKRKNGLRDYFNLHNHSWMWLLGAAFAFGGGTTWAMHFISINALFLHFPSPLPPAAFPIVFLNERPIPQGVETWSSSIKSPQAMLEQMLGLGKGDWNKANLWSFQELSSTLREHQVRIIDYPSALQLLELRHDNGGMLPVIYQGAYSTLGLACAIAGAFLAFLLLDFSIPTSRGTGEEGSDRSSRNWFNRAFRRSGRGKRTERREQEDRSSRGTISIIERRGSDRAPSFDMREDPSSTRPSLISRSRAEGNQLAALSSAPPILFQSSGSTLGYFDVGYSITRATNPQIQDPSDRSSCSPPEESSKLLDTSRYHQQLAPGSTSTLVPSTPSSPSGLGAKLDKCSSPKGGSLREPSMDERRRESATTQVSAFEKEDKSSDRAAMDSLYLMNSISPGLTSGSISSTPGEAQKPLTMTPGEIELGEVEGTHSGSPARQSSFFSPTSRDRSVAQQRILHQYSSSGASSTFSFTSAEDQADIRGGPRNPNPSRRSSGGIALGSRSSGSRPASIIGMENQDRLADEVSLRSGSDYDSIDSAVRDHETVSRRRRMIRQALSAVLAGGGISAMHYASQSATLFVHYHYRPGYAIAGALSTVVIVFISFFILFDLLRPKLLNFFWARLPLAFLLSFASIMMHYTVVLGTSYYITTIQLADLLLNPRQWRSGRASRKSLIGLVASVATSLCITLAIVAIVSQRRTAKRKARNAQQRIVLAVCLLDKNGDVLVDLDGNFPMVEIGQEDSVSPLDKFMSPRLPQFTSTSAQNKCSVKMAMRKMMVAFVSNTASSEQGTSATLQKLSTDQNVFARCLRKTWEWHSPSSSSTVEQRSRSRDSRSSKEKASPQVSKLRFANTGAESSSTWKSSQDSSSKELQSSSRREGESKKKFISDQDRLKNNLESFYLPTDRPRRSSHLKPTTGEHQEELMTLKQETAEERFERLFERAASDLSKLCWGSEEVAARGKLGVLYDRVIPVGHVKAGGSETLARGQMLVIVRKLNTLAERENLLRSGAGSRGFAFAEMSAVAKRAVGSKGLGLRADETLPLISDLSNFGSQRTSLADQVSRGKVYISLVAVQSLLMGGLQIVVDPNLRHSLPMVELGDLSRVDGTQSFQSLGDLPQLKSSLKALSGHSLLSLIELTESLSESRSQRRGSTSSLAGNKWILNLLPLQAPATTESQKEKLKEVDHHLMAQEKLIKSLVRTLVAFLDAFFPIETVSYLLSRLTLASEVVALLPASQVSKGNGRNPRFRNSAGSQHQIPKALEIDQAYSINFKVVIPPDTELPGLTWVPYLLFSAHNECRSKAPSSRFNRYSNLVEGRRRSRAQSIDGSKVRSNTSRTSADAANLSSSSIRPRASTLEPSSSTSFNSLKDQVQLVKNKMWTNGRVHRSRLHHHRRSSSEPNTITLATSSRSFRIPVSPSPSKVGAVKSGYGDSGSLARSLEGLTGGGLRRRSIVPLSPVLSQHEDAEGEETEPQTLGAAMTGIETSVRSSSDYEPPSSSSFSRAGIKFNQNPLLGVSSSPNERFSHSSIAFTLPFGEESSQPQAFSHRAIEIPIPPDCIPSSSIASSRFPPSGQHRPIRSNPSIQERDSSSSNPPQPFLHPFLPGAASSSRVKARFPIQDQSHLSEQRRQSAPCLIQTNASRNSSVDASESSPHYEADWISKLLRKQLVEDEEAFTVEKELKLDLGLFES